MMSSRKWGDLSEKDRLKLIVNYFGSQSSVVLNENVIYLNFKDETEEEVIKRFTLATDEIKVGEYKNAMSLLGL